MASSNRIEERRFIPSETCQQKMPASNVDVQNCELNLVPIVLIANVLFTFNKTCG